MSTVLTLVQFGRHTGCQVRVCPHDCRWGSDSATADVIGILTVVVLIHSDELRCAAGWQQHEPAASGAPDPQAQQQYDSLHHGTFHRAPVHEQKHKPDAAGFIY